MHGGEEGGDGGEEATTAGLLQLGRHGSRGGRADGGRGGGRGGCGGGLEQGGKGCGGGGGGGGIWASRCSGGALQLVGELLAKDLSLCHVQGAGRCLRERSREQHPKAWGAGEDTTHHCGVDRQTHACMWPGRETGQWPLKQS